MLGPSLLVKHQLLIINRSRERAPLLLPTDRLIAGLCVILMRPTRFLRSAILLKPSTILSFHRTLVKRKYRLYSRRKIVASQVKGALNQSADD